LWTVVEWSRRWHCEAQNGLNEPIAAGKTVESWCLAWLSGTVGKDE
jgi:hypothetical protein